jgi:hypothetical protein
MTAANAILKEYYSGQKVQNMAYKSNPLLALLPKDESVGGKYYPVPTQYGLAQGGSNTFANAQANQGSPSLAEFLVTMKKDYAVAQIENQLIASANGDSKAFLNAVKLHVDGAIKLSTLRIARALFRSGTGSIGRISTISTGLITLTAASDVTNFEVGQVLQCTSGTTDGNTPRVPKGYVIAVSRSAGTVTVSDSAGGAAATPTGWTTSEYLLMDGDSNASISGLQAWLPASAPGTTAFYGVDRSVDTWRLGGGRYDGSSYTIQEALTNALALVHREGGEPSHCFMNFTSYAALENALGAKVQYVDLKGPADVAFRGIRINGPTGPVDVIADRNCPATTAFLLQMDTWKLIGAGKVPAILTYGSEGMEMLRVSNADSAEVRVGSYSNLTCNAPGWNVNVTLSA